MTILGVVQGLTEFLPISSSGHLVILQNFLKINEGGLEFAIILHLATLFAVCIAYHKAVFNMIKEFFLMLFDLIRFKGANLKKNKYRKYIVYIIIASVPAAIVGILFDDFISEKFSSLTIVAFTLMITGVILMVADKAGKMNKEKIENFGPLKSFLVGIAQMFAITPGISRSGSTISAGLLLGLEREEAVEFSFLLSLPAILGSLLLKFKDILSVAKMQTSILPLIIGFISALVVGFFSIKLLVAIVKKGSLMIFSVYCFLLSSGLFIYMIIS